MDYAIQEISRASDSYDRVVGAIKRASTSVGVEFSYLLNKAKQESGLDPAAKAKTSTATGLFQFIEQTWLRMVKTYGDKYGLSEQAGNIAVDSSGNAKVGDPASKRAILELRKNPEIAACMAAELAKENRLSLERQTGGKVGGTELYLAHFLGAGGASSFLCAMRANPNASAAGVLPEAAAANPGVFYDKSGQSKSLAQVYGAFAEKFKDCGGKQAVAASSSAAAKFSQPALPSFPALSDNGQESFVFSQHQLAFPAPYTEGGSGLADSPALSAQSVPQFVAMMLAQNAQENPYFMGMDTKRQREGNLL